jgi:hypothetical protein
MIYVSCQFETPIGRSDYSDYVRALQIDISGCDAEGDRVLLGKIAADQVLVGDAQVDGMPLFDVCDQDSQGLHDAYVALFDATGEFQSELNLDDPADTLIFIWRAVVHSRLCVRIFRCDRHHRFFIQRSNRRGDVAHHHWLVGR